MNYQFKYGEDLDLGLRLAKQGILQLRRPYDIVIHHTISYENEFRFWASIKNWHAAYSRGLLYRKNILNKYTYKRMLSSDPTFIVLILATLCCVWDVRLLLLYPLLLSLAIIIKYGWKLFGGMFIPLLIRDMQVFFSFLLFFPSKRENINYSVVRDVKK